MVSVTVTLRVSPRVYITLCVPQPQGRGIPNRATAKVNPRVKPTSTFSAMPGLGLQLKAIDRLTLTVRVRVRVLGF